MTNYFWLCLHIYGEEHINMYFLLYHMIVNHKNKNKKFNIYLIMNKYNHNNICYFAHIKYKT